MEIEELQAVKHIVQETPAEGRVWNGQPVRDAICAALERWWERRQTPPMPSACQHELKKNDREVTDLLRAARAVRDSPHDESGGCAENLRKALEPFEMFVGEEDRIRHVHLRGEGGAT